MGSCTNKTSTGDCIKVNLIKVSNKHLTVSSGDFIKATSNKLQSKYQILKFLGQGSFAKVYLCLNLLSGQGVALKVAKKSKLSAEMCDETLKLKEAEILSALDHPNIIKCLEVVEEATQIILVEEFARCGSLAGYFRSVNMNLDEKSIILIMKQILSALVYMHNRGVVHRDIKLENIFLSSVPNLEVKIGDFGNAVFKDSQEHISGLRGTLLYLAPEILTNRYTEKVDIWSCGILLFILLKKKLPYSFKNKENLMEILKKNPISHILPELKSLPPDCSAFIKCLLNPDPQLRSSAKQALKHPWLQKYSEETQEISQKISKKIVNPQTKSQLKKLFSLYICSFLLNSDQTREYLKIFQKIDVDKNGTIEKTELKNLLKTQFSEIKAEQIAENFFCQYDLNSNGVIDYSEFLLATCSEKIVLDEKNIEKVFMEVDKAKTGFVTISDIEIWGGVQIDGILKGMDLKRKMRIDEIKRILL